MGWWGFARAELLPPPPPHRRARPGKGRLPYSGPPYARRPRNAPAPGRDAAGHGPPKNAPIFIGGVQCRMQNTRPLSLKRTGWRRGRAEPAGPDGRRGASQHAKKGRMRGGGREGGREGDLTGGEARCRDVRVPDAPGQPGRKLRLQVPRSWHVPRKPRAADSRAAARTAGPRPGIHAPRFAPPRAVSGVRARRRRARTEPGSGSVRPSPSALPILRRDRKLTKPSLLQHVWVFATLRNS